MRRILDVARREYTETVKTKAFLIGLLFVPVIIVAVVVLTGRMAGGKQGPRPPLRMAFTTDSSELAEKIEKAFSQYNSANPDGTLSIREIAPAEPNSSTEEAGKAALRAGRLDAFAVLAGDLMNNSGTVEVYTHRPKPTHIDALQTVDNLIYKVVVDRRCETQGFDRALLNRIRDVKFERKELGAAEGQERVQNQGQRIARMMVPFAFMYLIFMGTITTGQQMLSSIIEEKSSRVIEVLLSTISPFQLMAGKILGLVGIGLTVTTVWALAAYTGVRWQGLEIEVGSTMIAYLLVYYLLGFVLFCAVLAGIGSICNTIKETQSLMMPVMFVFIIPLLSWLKLVRDPNGLYARILSFVPPVTPLVMVVRLSTGAQIAPLEIAASILVLMAGVLGAVWIAAKIFRTGILMYGKRPQLREVLHWLAAK